MMISSYYNFRAVKHCLFVCLLIILFCDQAMAALKTGQKAPVFTLSAESGENVSFPQGKSLILSFFASWCQQCRDELPLLDSSADELEKKKITVAIIGVKENYEKIGALLRELNINKLVVLSDRMGKVTELYQIRFLPTTFFIGSDGMVKDIIFGEIRNASELKNCAQKLE